MSAQRIAAALVGGGALLGLVSVVALGAGAAGLDLPRLPAPPVAVPTGQPAPPPPSTAPVVEEVASGELDPSLVRGGIDPAGVPLAFLETLTEIPELDPDAAEYVAMADRAEWMAREHLISACMADHGITYHVAAWWLGEQSQPRGLSFEESIRFLEVLGGSHPLESGLDRPLADQGCAGAADQAIADAAAAGTRLAAEVPEPDPVAPTPRQRAFAFEQAIERCMEEAGFDYLLEWERQAVPTGELTGPDAMAMLDPSMPPGLDPAQRAAWEAQQYGDPLLGAEYRWQDAGCHGHAVHVTGNDNMH